MSAAPSAALKNAARSAALVALLVAFAIPAPARASSPYYVPVNGNAFFAPTSVWNQPLSSTAPIDPSSPTVVNILLNRVNQEEAGAYGPWIATNAYTTPIYTVGAGQPTVHVTLDGTGTGATALQAAFNQVPLPSGAQADAGSDGQLTLYQPATDTLWEFFKLQSEADGWHAQWGGAMQHVSTSPGYFDASSWPGGGDRIWGATATSLPLVGGLITLKDLQDGQINHALALAIPDTQYLEWAWPAMRGDGVTSSGIREGTRLRLDPNLNIAALNLPPLVAMMAQAAQRYGIVIRDTSSIVQFFGEDAMLAGGSPWATALGGQPTWQVMSQFPWKNLQVLRYPEAYSSSPASPVAGQPVRFDASQTTDPGGNITGYLWDFGDGSQGGSGITASHTYSQPGSYTAWLAVYDDAGHSYRIEHQITVGSPAPQARYSISPTAPAPGQAVTFDGTGTLHPGTSITSYAWNFGDGSTGSGATISHTYAAAGTYAASLTVTDSAGQTSTVSHSFAVGGPTSSAYRSAIMGEPRLVSYWRLGEWSGSVAADQKGVNQGASGSGVAPGAPGAIGSDLDTAFSLDGASGFVNVPSSSSLALTGDISIEAWVKPTDYANYNGVAGKTVGNLPAPFDFYLSRSSGRPVFLRGDGTYAHMGSVTATNPPPVGVWSHLVVTQTGSSVSFYLNGAPDGGGTISTTARDGGTALKLGSRDDQVTKFKGSLDEVAIYNGALSSTQVLNHYHTATGTSSPPPPSSCSPRSSAYSTGVLASSAVVGYWRLGEPSGSVACDSSSRGDSGAYTGHVTLGVPGAIASDPDTAVSLDGSGGFVNVPSSSSLALTGDMTIEAWVKPTDYANYNGIAGKTVGNLPAPYDFYLSRTSGRPVFLRGDGTTAHTALVTATSAPPVGVWSHLVVTQTGSSVSFYLNGASDGGGTISTTPHDGGTALKLGSRDDQVTKFKGNLDEVAIYNAALSSTQVLNHYHAGSGT